MGKAFEKQIKTIKDQGEKQIDALKYLKDQNKQLDNISDYKDDLLHSNERQIFKNIYSNTLDKIEERTKKLDDNNLIFITLITGEAVNFSRKNDPLTFLEKIRDNKITIKRANKLQEDPNNNKKNTKRK